MPCILPERHQVWAWSGKGDPDRLQREQRILPVPAPGEVLIANHAIGLNPVDWKMIEWGHPSWSSGHVPGVDGTGTIVALGDGVRLPLGLRVAYHQSITKDGSFAEFICIDVRSVIMVPDGVDNVSAAALPCAGLTAAQALHKVPSRAGQDVLVTGAGGAVGLILSQLAVQSNYRVWVTAAPSHRDMLLSLGVVSTFDYHAADWHKQLVSRLGPRRLHAIFDTISGEHANSLAHLLGYNGHLICIQDRIEKSPLPAFTTAISLHEVALNSIYAHATDEDWRVWRMEGTKLFRKLQTAALTLPKLKTVSFDRLSCALTELKKGQLKGKVVAVL